MSNISCEKCGSHRVTQNVRLVYFNVDKTPRKAGGSVLAEVKKNQPISWYERILGKIFVRKPLYINVCADCGNVDVHISPQDAQEIWEADQKDKSL